MQKKSLSTLTPTGIKGIAAASGMKSAITPARTNSIGKPLIKGNSSGIKGLGGTSLNFNNKNKFLNSLKKMI